MLFALVMIDAFLDIWWMLKTQNSTAIILSDEIRHSTLPSVPYALVTIDAFLDIWLMLKIQDSTEPCVFPCIHTYENMIC